MDPKGVFARSGTCHAKSTFVLSDFCIRQKFESQSTSKQSRLADLSEFTRLVFRKPNCVHKQAGVVPNNLTAGFLRSSGISVIESRKWSTPVPSIEKKFRMVLKKPQESLSRSKFKK